jgi:membrane-anchored protein YejM (alkaline phosphatase superfamily)
MNHFIASPRRCLYRMLAWFFLVNAVIASLVVFGYCALLPSLAHVPGANLGSQVFGVWYFFAAFFAQICVYEFALAAFCCLIATLLPYRVFIVGVASFFAALILAAVIGDTIAFRLYHIHYAQVGWQIFLAGAFREVLPLGLKEQVTILVAFIICCLLEVSLALWLWRVFAKPGFKRLRRIVFGLVFVNLFVVYLAFGLAMAGHFWSTGYRYAILRVGRISPYLAELYIALFEKHQTLRPILIGQEQVPLVLRDHEALLNYPKHPMQATQLKKHLNVVLIAIDTWRYTAMTPKITPNINRFSKRAVQFRAHHSGGNCTQPGLFSLFYSLPPNYWQAALDQHKSPVLINALERSGYDLGIFLSAPINFPRFDQTIFSDVMRLTTRISGASSIERDQKVTQNFLTFLSQQKDAGRPFFSFLFYDAVHNYCESARPKNNPFQPAVSSCDRFSLDAKTVAQPYLNLYYNKVHFVDHEVGKILAALQASHHDQDTVVIITADHGEEVNDKQSGLWGHASAYDPYQLHVPLLVYWPGHPAGEFRYPTQHYDLAPSLIKDLLGYTNPVTDYAVGRSLWDAHQTPYFLAGSYGDYAVIMRNKVMRIYPDGDYAMLDRYGKYLDQQEADPVVLKRVLADLTDYFAIPPSP